MIKNVIFDMEGVIRGFKDVLICDILPYDLKNVYEKDLKEVTIRQYVSKWHILEDTYKSWDLGLKEKDDVLKDILNFSNKDDKLICFIFEKYLTNNYRFIFPQTLKLILKLKDEGYNIFCLSNMGKENVKLIEEMLDLSIFKGVIFSCNVGLIKPNKDIYDYAINFWKIKAQESLYIDDNILNLLPFEKMNGKTFLFDNKNLDETILKAYNFVHKLK